MLPIAAVLQQLLSSIHSVSEEAWREMTAEEQLRLLNQQQLSHDDDVIALTGVQTDERGDDEEDDSQEYEESYEEQESSDHVENNPSSRKTSLQTPQQSRRVSQVMNEGAGELPRRNHLIVNSPAADRRPSVGHFDAADRLQVTTGATTVDGRKTSLGNLEGPHRKASVQRAEVNSGRLVGDVLQRDDHRTQKLQMESTNNGNQANCDHTITVEVKTLNGGDPVQQQPTSQRAGVTFNILPVVSTANGDRSKTKEHERGRP